MEKKFVANKAVIVNQTGKILLVRDAGVGDHENALGKLDLPGGRMDQRETPVQGLLRELQEEIGVSASELTVERPFHVDIWGVKDDVINQPVVGIFYIVRARGEIQIALSSEHSDYFWFDPHAQIPKPCPEWVCKVIEAYRTQESIVIASEDPIKGRQGYGLIQLFTGNGKGKTTAALGEAIRALGAGKKVGIVYFDKGGDTHYFERKILEKLGGVHFVATGRDRIDPVTGRFDFSIQEMDTQEAVRGLEAVRQMFKQQYDLIVMDEINSTTDLGMLSVQSVLLLLDEKPEHTELILTGRNAPQEFLDRAHLVTQMKLQKHYFYSGVKAREGLDY